MWNSLLRNLAVVVAVGAVALMKQTDTTFWELVPEERTFSEEYVAGEETYTIQFDNTLEKYYGNDYEAFIFELSLMSERGEILQQFSFDAEENFGRKLEDLTYQSYEACRIEDGEVVELRDFELDFYNETISIEDCISGEILYEGALEEDEEGNLLNCEFYEEIFLSGIETIK